MVLTFVANKIVSEIIFSCGDKHGNWGAPGEVHQTNLRKFYHTPDDCHGVKWRMRSYVESIAPLARGACSIQMKDATTQRSGGGLSAIAGL